jgi:hypothetical protein
MTEERIEPALTRGAGAHAYALAPRTILYLCWSQESSHHAGLGCSKLVTHADPNQPKHMSTNRSALEPSHGHQLLRLH